MPIRFWTIILVIGVFITSSFAADSVRRSPSESSEAAWLESAGKENVELEAPAEGPPPLPFHTIEGYGGGAITPMAYLVNPPKQGGWFGFPAVAFSNVIAGRKNLQAFTATENLFGRFELGYGLNRLGLGTLPGDIRNATGIDIKHNEVWMHNFNLRGLLLEENAFGSRWLPAVTAGVHFKVNSDIENINDQLGGALSGIGYDRPWGIDYTLTASKTLMEKWTLNRPLILTVGLRNSEASNLGFLGFGGDRHTTVEGSVVYIPADWLLVAYEFRQKGNQYSEIPGLVEEEDNWNAIDVSWIINQNATLVAGWGAFGNMVNGDENGAWWVQFKYEF